MGTYAIDAAIATKAQVASAFGISDDAAWAKIAVTPMIAPVGFAKRAEVC